MLLKKWEQLTHAEQINFIKFVQEEYSPEKGYTDNEILKIYKNIPKSFYRVEDGTVYQY